MIKTTKFKGVRVQITRDRIAEEDRDPDKFYYEFQHEDGRAHLPFKLEQHIQQDFWGTMIADDEIQFNNGDFHSLNEDLSLKIAKAFGLIH